MFKVGDKIVKKHGIHYIGRVFVVKSIYRNDRITVSPIDGMFMWEDDHNMQWKASLFEKLTPLEELL